MKQLILLMAVCFTCLGVKAQVATTDYIYSSDGFVVKTGEITLDYYGQSQKFYSTGLYTKDGKTLVAAIFHSPDYNKFYVIDGCETICSGAFQKFTSLTVYIPSSVRSIAPDAIISRSTSGQTPNGYGGIQDGVREKSGSGAVNAPVTDPNATEVARYNVQGVRLSEPTNGVNIVQMSDGSAEKVLVR